MLQNVVWYGTEKEAIKEWRDGEGENSFLTGDVLLKSEKGFTVCHKHVDSQHYQEFAEVIKVFQNGAWQ